MEKNSKIYIAGHSGLLGSAIVRKLTSDGYNNLIVRSHSELDLTNQAAAADFFKSEKPEYVFLAAAKVGGIQANANALADFFYINASIYQNVIHQSYSNSVRKLIFFGSSCIYPKNCPQPIREEYLLSDYLEKTNEGFSIAKIAGLKMCSFYRKQYDSDFISCMFTNLYGPNDNFDLNNSHVLPALLHRFHEAKLKRDKQVVVWGTGSPLREFLYIDDAAESSIFLMKEYSSADHINVGTGEDISIFDLAHLIKTIVGFEGELIFDHSKPDGTYRKLLDVSRMTELGWKSKTGLEEGIRMTYEWYLQNNI